MINRNPETLSELRLVRNVLAISKYYTVSQEFIDEAYDFLKAGSSRHIAGYTSTISFYEGSKVVKSFQVDRPISSIDGIYVSATTLRITPHYTPSSYSGFGGGSSFGSSSGSSWSGSSSNNNNNNNNNH
ncbi:MAG: hypothetical protein J6X28_03720 [Bacilli bacterium]|nr:hypothetical protein [Bacilli bacterium]